MREKPCLGISLYIKSSFQQLTQSIIPKIVDYMLPFSSPKAYVDGKVLDNLQKIQSIPPYSLESWKEPLIIAQDKDSLVNYAQVLQPKQVFSPIPQHIGILIDPENFDNARLLALCKEIRPLYGFVCQQLSALDAYDEVFWPAKTLSQNADNRMHTDAWIRLMRSFARNDIDSSIPDIYWANIFGPRIINEIRRKDAWNALESLNLSQYIDNNFLYLKLSPYPQNHRDPEFLELQEKIGDILSPLACIQKPLLQTRHGNALLLNDLAQTRDPRLLLGLATKDGLPTFISLLPEEHRAEILSVADALAYLQRTQGQRPRCYGESLWQDEREEKPTESQEQSGENAEQAQSSTEAAPEQASPVPTQAQDSKTQTAEQSAFNWNIRTLSHSGLRLDLATLQLTLDDAKDKQSLELGISNVLPRAQTLLGIYAVRIKDELPTLIIAHDKLLQKLPPNAKPFHITLELPFPQNDEQLRIYAPIQYNIDEPIVDIIHTPDSLSVIGSSSSQANSLTTWPVAARVHIHEKTIYISITNTTQECWVSWQLSLILAGAPDTPFAHYYNNTALNSGERAYAQLDASFIKDAKALQILLRANATSNTELATFDAKN